MIGIDDSVSSYIRCGVVEKWLYTHTVTNQKQLFGSNVPDRESKHSVETFDNIVAPLQISAEHDFRVAARFEPVAELAEFVDAEDFLRLGGNVYELRSI